jgi:hypothetical protein
MNTNSGFFIVSNLRFKEMNVDDHKTNRATATPGLGRTPVPRINAPTLHKNHATIVDRGHIRNFIISIRIYLYFKYSSPNRTGSASTEFNRGPRPIREKFKIPY